MSKHEQHAKKSLASLERDLEVATRDLTTAVEVEKTATAASTRCRNAVNQLQKQVDAHLAELRKSAPWNTDWSSRTSNA